VTPVLTGYNMSVQVVTPAAAILGIAPTDIRRVTVTVRFGADAVSLTGYRFNYAAT
jgi:hypothetical protein